MIGRLCAAGGFCPAPGAACAGRPRQPPVRLANGQPPTRVGRTMPTAANDFSEHRIARDGGELYARDYAGAGPAFVLMHGFPDNLGIYDDLIPYLVASGRRVVAFDFLGFGDSDKLAGAIYSFKQQLGDLETVVEVLGLGKIVPVAHDASGPAAINFAIEHPDQVDSV